MSTRVIRRMSLGKASVVVFVVVAILTTLFMLKMSQGQAAPTDPKDQTQVPHYFGPFPNWALSPLTMPDATVAITSTDPGSGYTSAAVGITGLGTGAAANAVVTLSGAVSSVTVNNPGAAYT